MTITFPDRLHRHPAHRFARTMSIGPADSTDHAVPGAESERPRIFSVGSHAQRLRKLHEACSLLADGMDDLEELIVKYVREVPLSPRITGRTDAERFLNWLDNHETLSAEHRDYVRCQQGRNVVEFVAVMRRLAHVRFQELLSMNERLLADLETNPRLVVHLNPIHVWSRFETRALLDEEDSVPASVLFFPVGSEIRTVAIEPEAEELIQTLDRAGAARVKDLKKLWPKEEHDVLRELLTELAEMGVVALG
jgi:hypothetical protein